MSSLQLSNQLAYDILGHFWLHRAFSQVSRFDGVFLIWELIMISSRYCKYPTMGDKYISCNEGRSSRQLTLFLDNQGSDTRRGAGIVLLNLIGQCGVRSHPPSISLLEINLPIASSRNQCLPSEGKPAVYQRHGYQCCLYVLYRGSGVRIAVVAGVGEWKAG